MIKSDRGKIYQYVSTKLNQFKTHRSAREKVWLECWQMYLGTREARSAARAAALAHVGDVNTNWRHNINTGKAFEIVETIVSYLQQAFFPNRDWFDAVPTEPGYVELSKIVKNYVRNKLTESKFISHWEIFLRQMAITGQSVLALPWRYETKRQKKKTKVILPGDEGYTWTEEEIDKVVYNNHEFEVLDIFDCYFDPHSIGVYESPFIRRTLKTKAEILEKVKLKYYTGITPSDVQNCSAWDGDGNKTSIKMYQGLATNIWSDRVEVYEYWGDLQLEDDEYYQDVVVTWIGDKVVRVEDNPFWCGKPFVFGTYTPIVRSPVALGAIEPSLGMLHELDIITNQRLDNLELASDVMYEYVNDGTLQPEDIFTQPGKVFTVASQGTIRPIETSRNFVVSYDEATVLEQRIDKNAGTGNYISTNTARSGERVTATEVQAVKDAGGNRLSGLHKHIEETALLVLLDKIYRCYQQFVTDEEIVRVPSTDINSYDYVAIDAEDLSHDFRLIPVGADHVADKEFEISQRMAFLQIVSGNPEMSKHIDYYAFMYDLARRMGIDEIDQFIKQEEQPQQIPAMMNPDLEQPSTVSNTMGRSMADALKAELVADGGASLVKDTLGLETQGVDLMPQLGGIL